jgi:hypothetical protein
VYAVRFTTKGVGKPAVLLSPAAGTSYGKPQLADDSNGDTFVLAPLNVTTKTSQNEHLVVRKWSKAGALGQAITVGTAASTITLTNIADGPALAADGAGDVVVVWNSALSSTQAAVYGRRLSHTGSLGPANRLGTGYLPHIGIAPAGLGLITWQSTPYQSGRVTTIYGRVDHPGALRLVSPTAKGLRPGRTENPPHLSRLRQPHPRRRPGSPRAAPPSRQAFG